MRRAVLLSAVLLFVTAAHADWQSIGPDGGYIQAFGIDPQDASVLYAVPYEYPANGRMLRSTDAGASWTAVGVVPSQNVTFFAVDPHHNSLLYAGGRTGQLCRSTDRGANWSLVSMPGYGTGIASDRVTPGRLYVSGYYNHGGANRSAVYVSTDYGLTWTPSMPEPDSTGYAYCVAADPVDSGTVYVGAYRSKVFKSTDAGASWAQVSSGIPTNAAVQALSVNRTDNEVVLAATSGGLFRTTDGGAVWGRVGAMTSGMGVRFSTVDPSVAYAVAREDSFRVYVSTDAGASWTAPMPGYVTGKVGNLVPDPGDAATAYVSSTLGIHRSTDQGVNWHAAHTGLRITKISCISGSRENPRRLYLEMDANGVYRSTSGGDTWTRCSDFLACGNICGIGVGASTDRDVLYALEGKG